MELRLKVLVGKNQGQELLIPGPKFFIGRAEDCHLRPRSDLISRHHCALCLDGDYVYIRDFGSKNGTYVNEQPVAGEQELRTGDKLKIGPLEFEVQLRQTAPPKKRPKVESIKEVAVRTVESAMDDLDVSQWLAPNEPVGKDGDTRVISINETSVIDVKDIAEAETLREVPTPVANKAPAPAAAPVAVAAPAVAPAAVAAPSDSAETTTVSEVETPAPTPPPKPAGKAGNKDSGTAANDVLSKFFKRR